MRVSCEAQVQDDIWLSLAFLLLFVHCEIAPAAHEGMGIKKVT